MHCAALARDGRLEWADPLAIARYLRRLEGQRLVVAIRRPAEPVTLDQHGYYRAVILPLAAEEWGWGNPAELHYELKLLHLPGVVPIERWPRRRLGVLDRRSEPPSCADLTKDEMRQFIDLVIRQMQDAGIDVPPPRRSGEEQ